MTNSSNWFDTGRAKASAELVERTRRHYLKSIWLWLSVRLSNPVERSPRGAVETSPLLECYEEPSAIQFEKQATFNRIGSIGHAERINYEEKLVESTVDRGNPTDRLVCARLCFSCHRNKLSPGHEVLFVAPIAGSVGWLNGSKVLLSNCPPAVVWHPLLCTNQRAC